MANWEQDGKVYKIKVVGEDVVVGDQLAVNFKPKVKLNKWKGECSIDLDFPDAGDSEVTLEDGKLKQKKTDYEVIFDADETSFHYDFILNKKFKDDYLVVNFDLNGLTAHYQGELTPEEIADGAIRPDNIVGSYAIYHTTKRGHRLGETNYTTGKAFHLYRPLATDDNGIEHWVGMEIIGNELRLNVSDDWFKNTAKYPVYIDPNFGYEIDGKTGQVGISGVIQGTIDASGGVGVGESMTAYVHHTGGGGNFRCALYDSSRNFVTNGGTNEGVALNTAGWVNVAFPTGPTIANANYYCVAWSNVANTNLYYDSSADGVSRIYESDVGYPSWPPGPLTVYTNRYFSVYCTYGAAGGAYQQQVIII